MTKKFRHPCFFRLMVIAMAGWLLTATGFRAVAQEWQTVAVFSMISTDEGAPLTKQALTAAGHPGLLDDFEKVQREAFATMDFSKPKGLVWQTNGRSFRFLAFAAMRDVTDLPYGIGDTVADSDVNRDGWSKMPLSNVFSEAGQMPIMYQNLFVKQQGDWAYACYGVLQAPRELPDDPTILLEGVDKEYPVALRFNSAALPRSIVNGWAALGKMSLSMLKTFIPMVEPDSIMGQFNKAGLDLMTVFGKETIDQLVKFINETESVTIGLSGNAESDVIVTCKLVAKPDTDYAKAIESISGATTDLIGFYRAGETIYSEIYAMPMPAYQQTYYKNLLKAGAQLVETYSSILRNQMAEFASPDDMEVLDKEVGFINAIGGVLQQTIDAGKFDWADSFTTDMEFIAAMKIAGGNALIEAAKKHYDFIHLKMAEQMADDFDPDDYMSMPVLECEVYKGVHLWKVSIPMPVFPSNDPDGPRLTGTLTYVFGLSDGMVVVGYGPAPTTSTVLDTIKTAIDKSGQPIPVPKEIVIVSPEKIGRLMKTYGFEGIVDDDQISPADLMCNIPEDANIVVTQDIERNVLTWTCVYSGKLWPTVGTILDAWLRASDF